jgi:hypothetical protein
VRAPEGEMAIVFTDIVRAASLWEFNPAAMRDATVAHNQLLRSLLPQHRGYEAMFIKVHVDILAPTHGQRPPLTSPLSRRTVTAARARSAWPSRAR